MKKIYSNKLFLTAFAVVSLIALMSNSSGRANVFGQAVTGAPGDSNLTCASSGCHSSGAFSPSAELTVMDADGNEVTSFAPGETYDVTLSVQATGSPSAYGFQMVALTSDNSPATNWSENGSNTQIVPVGGRDYIEHDSPSSSNEFTTKWTAPEAGAGDVTFYFSANAVNGNGNPGGDGGTNSTFVLSELTTSSHHLDEASIAVFPNPAQNFINITGENLDYEYTIQNLQGQRLISSNFSQSETIDLSGLSPGLYLINVMTDGKKTTKKIVKN